jgi:hypothetical protein
MIKYEHCLLFHKIENNQLNFDFQLIVRNNPTERSTRRPNIYQSMFSKLTFVRDSFFGQGVSIYNNLPEEIRSINAISLFKEKLKSLLKT